MTENTATGLTAEPFSDRERDAMRALAGLIIPESEEYGVPGADDPVIFAEILEAAALRKAEVNAALSAFAALHADDPDRCAETFRERHPTEAALLQTLVVQCYYRDDRVLTALGIEPRPPFPKGYEVEQGDWSLLDPVRARPPIYRKTP